MNHFELCPRCDRIALECLYTHSHCWECNYSPDYDASLSDLHDWRRLERRNTDAMTHSQMKRDRLYWLASQVRA